VTADVHGADLLAKQFGLARDDPRGALGLRYLSRPFSKSTDGAFDASQSNPIFAHYPDSWTRGNRTLVVIASSTD
jgi:hypothetical protein